MAERPTAIVTCPHNLPIPRSPLLGRDQDVAATQQLLLRPDVGVLTLTGVGGTGKTRLALRVASTVLAHFEHGVFFVNLAPIRDPALVVATIAQTLDIREASGWSLLDNLKDYLRDKQMLLLLDNFEQVVEAAPLVADLLAASVGLKVMVTSRARLRLRDEHEYPVFPLSVPSAEFRAPSPDQSALSTQHSALITYDAVRLFEQRAQALKPDFALTAENASAVAEICRRLYGLPLAIELAAARIKLLPPQAMLARLTQPLILLTAGPRDAPARQQTMRNAIAWSYDLLSADEQRLFRRLSVFVGGFTLDAVEQVAGDGLDMSEGIASLVDNNLLRQAEQPDGEPRFTLLETIREYGLERLAESDEAQAIRSRHATYFLALAEQAEPQLKGPQQSTWLKYLEREHDNLRAVLAWAREYREAETGLRLAGALTWFWRLSGYWSEGRRWLEEALAQAPDHASRYRAKALFGAGLLTLEQADHMQAQPWLEDSITLWRSLRERRELASALVVLGRVVNFLGDRQHGIRLVEEGLSISRAEGDHWNIALGLLNLGLLAWHSADYARTRALYEESVTHWRTVGDRWGLTLTLGRLAYAASHQGDYDRATTVLAESAALQRELGTRLSLGEALGDLGFLAYLKGDYATARSRLEEYLAIVRELGLRWRIQVILSLLGEAARCLGDYEGAAALYAEGLALSRELDDKAATCMLLLNLGFVAHQQGDHSPARTRFAESLSLAFGLSNKRLIDVALNAIAIVAVAQGQPERAGRLFGAAETLAQVLGIVLDPPDQLPYEQAVTAARARPDAAIFDAAWAEGRTMSLEEAIELALSVEPSAVGQQGVAPMQPQAVTVVAEVAPLPELRIVALGEGRVYRGERLLTPSDWTFAQPRELLFYLLAHPARTKEQIGLDIWPDASPSQLRGSFHNTLYHLRRALGRRDWIITDEGGYRFNRSLNYWFDVEAFEKQIADSTSHLATGDDPATAISQLQAAIGLYQGDFLSDSDREWVLLKREELRRKYLDALLALGQALFASGDYASAANTYRQAISQDAYLEAAHRELMRCYARLDERGQAVRHYQGLVELLRDELDAPPAAETTALYERLKRSEET